MASRTLQIVGAVGAVAPLVFGILSLSFVAVSFASRDWVRQDYFPPQLQPLDWKDPQYTIYRSPFILCSANPFKNGSEVVRYDITCNRFNIMGRGQTACQTPNETAAYSSVTGDWRMCQQIHLSGNLILAALVFVSVAFATLAGLSYVFIMRATSNRRYKGSRGQNTTTPPADPTGQQPITSLVVIIFTYLLLAFLSVTAMCTFLSQFYGILGLVQSQPDNGIWASMSLGSVQDQQTGDLHHAPWVQGNVLMIHMSLAWFFSALTAGAIGGSWLGAFRSS
ncbi:hypothetical protein K469DRAFT_674865 [Zopfia rhizophila CBS 207.26]|uniref:Uncharacterized protein n=1 Tax=Zopfia rhizophila CBS 207.26 TaxID=1314779 RepID=A0A6A6DH98_9PEZI|nr:hypothetical protein K469DRAFT_674865 [Zopfia rhizophila CBS 207.26]